MSQLSELDDRLWAVVNAEGVCGTRLSYDTAVKYVDSLMSEKSDPSLVIVTNGVAALIEHRAFASRIEQLKNGDE